MIRSSSKSLFASTAMETEELEVPAGKKSYRKRAGSQKKSSTTTVLDISDSESEKDADADEDEDFDFQEQAAPEAEKKKGVRKHAAQKAKKPPAVAKKGGVTNKQSQILGRKFISEMLKPAENSGISPENNVRKTRESPFNKKGGSVLARTSLDKAESEDMSGSSSCSPGTDEVVEVAQARVRPQRVNRRQTRYVVSETESDDDSEAYATEDSDFEDED